jgi:hypothetical protein
VNKNSNKRIYLQDQRECSFSPDVTLTIRYGVTFYLKQEAKAALCNCCYRFRAIGVGRRILGLAHHFTCNAILSKPCGGGEEGWRLYHMQLRRRNALHQLIDYVIYTAVSFYMILNWPISHLGRFVARCPSLYIPIRV